MRVAIASAFIGGLSTVVATDCPADKCFNGVKLAPILNKAASIFCLNYVKPTPNLTTTKTAVVTLTSASAPAAPVQTTMVTAVTTITSGSICTTTISTGLSTFTSFVAPSGAIRKRKDDIDHESEELAKRELSAVPNNLMYGCKETGRALTAKISSACTCFLTPTATKTVTSTTTLSKTLMTPNAVTVQKTVTNTVVTQSCTSTTTVLASVAMFCGVPIQSYTSGTVTCSNTVPSPSSNALLRIEGNDSEGTIFEGCIVSGPRVITTPSGGTHQCDGTNNGANPSPGTTPTDQIDAAGMLLGFDYDGTYSNSFSDYFITRIRQSSETSTQFWGLLKNEQFTPVGGCQQIVGNGDRTLWAFDAFNKAYFLKLTTNYAAVAPGTTVIVTVNDGTTGAPVAGALMNGMLTNANGQVPLVAPTQPGCYLYKATRSDSIRSDTFYLSVF